MMSKTDNSSPTLFKVVYRVPESAGKDFEDALAALLTVSEQAAGYAGSDVVKPEPGSRHPEWQVLHRFATEDDLRRWRESPKTRRSAARVDALTIGAPKVERIHGMEAWFSLPDRRDVSPPPKWKMAIVSALAIYPLILLIPPWLSPVIGGLPEAAGLLVQLAIIIPLMNWIVIPSMTRLFRRWLYTEEPEGSPAGVVRPSSDVETPESEHRGGRGLALGDAKEVRLWN